MTDWISCGPPVRTWIRSGACLRRAGSPALLEPSGAANCLRGRRGRIPSFALADQRPHHIDAISSAVASTTLVLADGHHRYETARNYRIERGAGGVADPGSNGIMTLVVELAPDQLCVRAIHRLLHRCDGNRPQDRACHTLHRPRCRPQRPGGGCRARGSDAPRRRPRPGRYTRTRAARAPPGTRRLDARAA